MTASGLVTHPDYTDHDTGPAHPEKPDRLRAVLSHLAETGLMKDAIPIAPRRAEQEWVEKLHAPSYIRRVRESCERGDRIIDSMDTVICPRSFDVSLLAAGGMLAAVDAVMEGKVADAFCAVRPPGHHALKDVAMGFCLFNNVAIAARYVQERHHLNRVLIIDWDVHHGNGTQDLFYEDPSVFFFSIHQYPFYPGTGAAGETGSGEGIGYTLNAPMAAGRTDDDYVKVFEEKLGPAVERFRPDFILVSAGFDAHHADPLGGMNLTESGYARLTDLTRAWAAQHCGGRIVSTLEGGYDLDALARSVATHVSRLME